MTSNLTSTASNLASAASDHLHVDLHCIFIPTGGQKTQKKPFKCKIFWKLFFFGEGTLRNGLLEAVWRPGGQKFLLEVKVNCKRGKLALELLVYLQNEERSVLRKSL